jgi:glucose/arabinose dehydrogenase
MSLRLIQAGLLLVLGGCSGSSPGTAQAESGAARPFVVSAVATFDKPWAIAFLPGSGVPMTNSAIVSEKPGRLWLVDTATGAKRPIAGAPEVVTAGTGEQGGLLDVKASPNFAADRVIYLTYSQPSANRGSELALARARLDIDQSRARLSNLQVIWHDPAGGDGGQFGARIAFAPDGQSLFLSSGERQRFTPAQDPSQPLGKILHLTLDGRPASGNPWAGQTGAATVEVTDPPDDTIAATTAPARRVAWPGPNLTPAETWSLGHRNPYGLAFAPDGRLWETEMGPQGGDELNLILPGRNYGWPNVSNGSNYDDKDIRDHHPGDGFEPPKVFWNPSISPGGLLIYSGSLFPQWTGDALVPALSGEALIHVRIRGDQASKAEQWGMGARIRSAEQGPNGEVYLLEDGSRARLLRLTPAQTRR